MVEAFYLPYIDKRLHISGGEVTLFWGELIDIIKFAKSLGYFVNFVTNGTWALDENKVKEVKQLGVNEVEISLTPYHLKFFKKDEIIKILRNLKKYKVSFFIRYVTSKSNNIFHLYNMLRDELFGIHIVSSPVLRLGRARLKIPEREFFGDENFPVGSCFDSLILTITPNGIFPCCNGSEITKYGKLGSFEDSLVSILNRNIYSPLRLLTLIGPSRLLKELKLEGKFKNKKYINICELCNEILNDDEVISATKKILLGQRL